MSQNTDNLLLSVINSKEAIKTALESLGINMDEVAFSEYADKIHNIPTGTGVTFFNKTITTVGTFSVDIVPTFTTYDHNG
jgi:hypothetical protein